MSLPKKFRKIGANFLCLVLAVGGLLAAGSPPALAQAKIAQAAEIQAALAQDGLARVIVEFQVPDLAKLTNASRAARQDFQSRGAQGLNQAAVLADEALIKAVSTGADAVLNALPANSFQMVRRLRLFPFLALW
ncbi:MAG: hypothetical protein KQJ78_21535 [Deltaproteobacteria bacterium]|nr:hypothetical protein [Deltaproteobacteria bacterium]